MAKKVKESWEKVFIASKRAGSFEHKVFETKKFRDIRKKIKFNDDTLTKLTTKEELKEIMKNISNGTAPGPDNIPNEIIKILFQLKEFEEVLIKIINTCLIQKRIPERWKNSNIYTIYKKDNPNNLLNEICYRS